MKLTLKKVTVDRLDIPASEKCCDEIDLCQLHIDEYDHRVWYNGLDICYCPHCGAKVEFNHV